MSKHTPGPWKVSTYSLGEDGLSHVVVTDKDDAICGGGHDVLYPDALLIAAAPELLAAIKNYIDDVGVEDREQLEALIAKAEGRS